MIFDYETLAAKHNIHTEILEKLVTEAKKEFGNDEMMIELHVVRAIRSLKRKGTTQP